MWKDINDLLEDEPLQLARVLATCINAVRAWNIATRGLTHAKSILAKPELIADPLQKTKLSKVEWIFLQTITKFDQETGNELPLLRTKWYLIQQMFGNALLAEDHETTLLADIKSETTLNEFLKQRWKHLTPFDATFSLEDIQLALSLLSLP